MYGHISFFSLIKIEMNPKKIQKFDNEIQHKKLTVFFL